MTPADLSARLRAELVAMLREYGAAMAEGLLARDERITPLTRKAKHP